MFALQSYVVFVFLWANVRACCAFLSCSYLLSVMLTSYDQWLTTLLLMVVTTLPLGRNAMFCMDRYNCTHDDILYSTKIEDVVHFFVSSHVSEIHMSEACRGTFSLSFACCYC